jgi:hypothetical protein
MARPCSVCRHPAAGSIAEALAEGRSAAAIAAEHGLSDDAVLRHKAHLARRATAIVTAPASGDPLDELVSALRRRALAGDDPSTAREYRLALSAQTATRNATAPAVDLSTTADWLRLRDRHARGPEAVSRGPPGDRRHDRRLGLMFGPPRRPRQRPLGPTDSRAPVRRRRHGLSVAEQDALRAAQGGVCAICRRPGPLYVDHDHRHCPGKEGCSRCVRGMLDNACNSALGWLGQDDRNVERIIAYLGGTP